MRAVVQRVAWARVTVDGLVTGEIGPGLAVLVAAGRESTGQQAKKLADRIVGMRIFSDEAGKMNLSLADLPRVEGPRLLVVSNFTLYGDAWASRRPSFGGAAAYADGERLYEDFLAELDRLGWPAATGVFGGDMRLELLNDGPVTMVVDSP